LDADVSPALSFEPLKQETLEGKHQMNQTIEQGVKAKSVDWKTVYLRFRRLGRFWHRVYADLGKTGKTGKKLPALSITGGLKPYGAPFRRI